MRRWQPTGLVLGAAALILTARPALAQVWISPSAPVVVAPAPVVVGPGWGARPYWGVRRYNRALRRGGWYGAAWGPRGRVVAVGRRW
jgi:hypothetical protein